MPVNDFTKSLAQVSTLQEAIALLRQQYPDTQDKIPVPITLLDVLELDLDAIKARVTVVEGDVSGGPVSATVTWAAGTGTDDADITVQFLDVNGAAYSGVVAFDFWISEANTGAGLTADSYSGDVTVTTGTEVQEIVSKKYFRILTDEGGSAIINAVASANPTDQYACISNPLDGSVIVSSASGTNWEGA